jgi:hypothetical protein
MKKFAISVVTIVLVALLSQTADAQWVRRYYRPVVVAPRPVTRVYRAPTIVYQPTAVVYARRRPILGGTVVRTRPGYRRAVVW